ncbi:MAG: adenylosuccinate lyase [Truepera sp.]|jgi:adenylosuccinate lyase|nr:adenylosuccinate lyase [Truepera sp.]
MLERYSTPDMRRLWSEAERYRTWLEVELAAMEAWEELGEVPRGTAGGLRRAALANPLDEAFAARVTQIEEETRHDIVAFTRALSERLGEGARFVHFGLTSTDVVDTAQNLILSRALDTVLEAVRAVHRRLLDLAQRHRHLPAIGRTHGVHAEPMTFGLKFLNFAAAFERDERRLASAKLGIEVAMLSGSVGTFAHVPPQVEEAVARSLGLAPDPITNQTVARDRHAEVMAALAILGTSVERVALEIRHLQRTEVAEAQEGFGKGQTGSSSMPHKKNPIASENLMGVARIMRSNLQAALENVALWHERDISHSSAERVILPDTTMLAVYALRRLDAVLEGLVVHERRVTENLDALHGLVYSQRVLHLLIEAGMSREAAYSLVQDASLRCWETGEHLRDLLAAAPGLPLSAEQLAAAFDPGWYLRFVDDIFARNGL